MERLVNARFHSMHRILDMLCLNLGETYRKETITTGKEIISQHILPTYSLHLQVQWRFIFQNRIILGSRDIYEPFSKDVGDDWDYALTGRPDNESSIFDVACKDISNDLAGQHIVRCTVSPVGDIKIEFSNGYIFEVFIPASYKDEEWRLIDFTTDEHLIFYDID